MKMRRAGGSFDPRGYHGYCADVMRVSFCVYLFFIFSRLVSAARHRVPIKPLRLYSSIIREYLHVGTSCQSSMG